MKKYIKPQIEVSNIEVESLLNGASLSYSISNEEITDEKTSSQRNTLSRMIGVTKNNSPY